MILYFGGVGSRDTPPDVALLMKKLAYIYTHKFGFILRTGGAEGADQAFSDGANGKAIIYVPWRGFKTRATGEPVVAGNHEWLVDIAKRLHPNWEACSPGARALLARNGAIALGVDPDRMVHSEFVIGWTPGGNLIGGTGQMIRVCKEYNVPFINLGDTSQWNSAVMFVQSHFDESTMTIKGAS